MWSWNQCLEFPGPLRILALTIQCQRLGSQDVTGDPSEFSKSGYLGSWSFGKWSQTAGEHRRDSYSKLAEKCQPHLFTEGSNSSLLAPIVSK
jgi:hypothetical protein